MPKRTVAILHTQKPFFGSVIPAKDSLGIKKEVPAAKLTPAIRVVVTTASNSIPTSLVRLESMGLM